MFQHNDPASLAAAATPFAGSQVAKRVGAILAPRANTGAAPRGSIYVALLTAVCLAPLGSLHVLAQQPQPQAAAHSAVSASAPQLKRETISAKQLQLEAARGTATRTAHAAAASHKQAHHVIMNRVAPALLAAQSENFPDVPRAHWAYGAVLDLKQKGILIGYPPAGQGAK